MTESSGRRARNGTDQHLRDPTAPLPPSGSARQPLPDAHRGGGGEKLWLCHLHPRASLCPPAPKGETQARKHLHDWFIGQV